MKKCDHKTTIYAMDGDFCYCKRCKRRWDVQDLVDENRKMRDALMFYADKKNYFGVKPTNIDLDCTRRARKALGIEEG